MKKMIFLVLASVMLCGCVNASSAPDNSVPTPAYGNYYLNGEKESGAYIELTEDTIVMKGENVEELFIQDIKNVLGEEATEENIKANLDNFMEQYAEPSDYVVSLVGHSEVTYMILNRWNKDAGINDNRYSGSGYRYDGEDTISLSGIGDFVYISE